MDNEELQEISGKTVSGADYQPVGFASGVGLRVSASFNGHVKSAKRFSFIEFIKEEKITIILTLLGALGILLLQFVAWKDIRTNGWVTMWATYFAMVAMVREVADPDICLFGATTILLLCRIITPQEAFAGFSNDSIITIALMIGIAAGLEATGVLNVLAKYVLGRGGKIWMGQSRMYAAVAAASAFMNNTPLVAVMIPLVDRWCKDNKMPVSLFMMPLSYGAILGGLCTIIGTSTNLIVRGLATNDYKDLRFGFFEIGIAGGPVVALALLYIIFVAPHLLANRKGITELAVETRRQYTFSAVVNKLFPGMGKSIEQAGLRNLPGVFVIDIQRADGTVVAAPGPDTILLLGDTITFAGDVAEVKTVLELGGLQAVGAVDLEKQGTGGTGRLLAEAVVSPSNPLVGVSIKEGRFRARYQASVVAVHREAQPLKGRIGDIVLRAGDTLLLETSRDFVTNFQHNREFAVVSDSLGALQPAGDPIKQMVALALFVAMIVINTLDLIELSTTGLALLFIYFALRVLTVQGFRDSIPGMILLTVAGAFGIARAMTSTGVAARLGANLVAGFSWMGRVGPLFSIYLATAILTALLSNGASVTIMYPIARAMVATTGIAPKAFFYIIMLAASSDFSTPIGYQTNLMVQPYGGYRFLDYTKFGVPLQILCAVAYTGICYWAFA